MEAINVIINNILQKEVGSLNNIMPSNEIPTAPIPVHTAYAVPNGNVCVALYKKYTLNTKKMENAVNHQANAEPVVVLSFPILKAKPISNILAMIRMIQFINNRFDKKTI